MHSVPWANFRKCNCTVHMCVDVPIKSVYSTEEACIFYFIYHFWRTAGHILNTCNASQWSHYVTVKESPSGGPSMLRMEFLMGYSTRVTFFKFFSHRKFHHARVWWNLRWRTFKAQMFSVLTSIYKVGATFSKMSLKDVEWWFGVK